MPPTSRGLRIARMVRHYATVLESPARIAKDASGNTKSSRKSKIPETAPPRPPKPEPRPELPPRSEPPSPATESHSFIDMIGEYMPRAAYRRNIGRVLIYAPIITLFWMHFPLEIMWTNGASMSPYLNPNSEPGLPETKDKLLIQHFTIPDRKDTAARIKLAKYKRGQIVVFYTPHDPKKFAVKRIVALPGDRIQPLPGYPGGDDPVVIQYNHLWVEGDVDNRDKSIDSNWYGPISQNLIIGTVRGVLEPWYSPTWINANEPGSYPAKDKGRVEYDAVREATIDPDVRTKSQAFANGRAEQALAGLKANRAMAPQSLKKDHDRIQAVQMYQLAKQEIALANPDTHQLAKDLVHEMEWAFMRAGYSRDGLTKRTVPAVEAELDEDQSEEQGRAQKALKAYLEKQKKERDLNPPPEAITTIGMLRQHTENKYGKEDRTLPR